MTMEDTWVPERGAGSEVYWLQVNVSQTVAAVPASQLTLRFPCLTVPSLHIRVTVVAGSGGEFAMSMAV